MKRLSFLLGLLFFVACEKNIEPGVIPEPEVEVKPSISPDSILLNLKCKLDFEAESMTKGNNDDLYAIRVYQFNGELLNGLAVTPVIAYGTFDDLSKAVIKLAKKYKYYLEVAYVPDGKNQVHKHSDGHYGVPFDAVWNKNGALNEVVYCSTSSEPVWSLGSGATQKKGISDYMVQSNNWSQIVRYQGVAMCDPNISSTIDVKLYYQMIGFRIKISDFENGKVILKGIHGHQYSTTPDNSKNGLIDVVIGPDHMPCASDYTQKLGEDYDALLSSEEMYSKIEFMPESVSIIYKSTSGEEVLLYQNSNFKYEPKTRYILSFSLSDAIANGGITAEVEDNTEMTEKEFAF